MPMSLINEAFAAISKKGQRVKNLINLTLEPNNVASHL